MKKTTLALAALCALTVSLFAQATAQPQPREQSVPLFNGKTALSLSEKQAIVKAQILDAANRTFRDMQRSYEQCAQLIEKNPAGLTKEEVIAGLGKDADKILILGAALRSVINEAKPGTIPDAAASP